MKSIRERMIAAIRVGMIAPGRDSTRIRDADFDGFEVWCKRDELEGVGGLRRTVVYTAGITNYAVKIMAEHAPSESSAWRRILDVLEDMS